MSHINTNSIITSIETNLQETIDLQQKQLDNIKSSYKKAEEFLLDNDCSQINEEDDVIIEVMKCLKKIKEQISSNDKDIKNIKNSIKSLECLSNTIDKSITEQLEIKIESINDNNNMFNLKLKEAKTFLDVLLSLEIICPACNSSNKNINGCSYCEGRGVINISKILENEKLLDNEFARPMINHYNTNNSYENVNYSQNYNNINNDNNMQNNTGSTKYVINKKK